MATNYIQLKDNDKNKDATMYIDGKPKVAGNIVGFRNSTWPTTMNKKHNFIFEGRERNYVFICAIKSIATGEEFLIDYNLNRIYKTLLLYGWYVFYFTQLVSNVYYMS